ncbi:MAG: tol-pal system protein YbgF [Deltaproteobacteria bacterium]|jgi:tol-pal system protein YbgF|nr:tol-pal system protein YbgF [Deltaproteobacteria bacterium]
MRLAIKIGQVFVLWLGLGLAVSACAWFGEPRPKPVERAEFEALTGRVTKLEDVVLKGPSPWLTPFVTPGGGALPSGASLPAKPSGVMDRRRYQRALSQVRSRRYSEAAATFEAMLAENPQGPLAPNARYWLGECHYARGDYSQALSQFQMGFQQYPTSNKAPDYLLKMSYSQSRLGDGPGAMESMRVLLERFPESNSARMVKSGRTRF